KRVGIGTSDVCMNESRAAPLAAVLNGGFADCIALKGICAIALRDVEAWETPREFRDAAARSLHLDGNRNGVAVVFNQVEEGKFTSARGVQGLPEFAFTGSAIARGDVNDFVGLVADMLAERSFFGLCQSLRMIPVIERGLRSTHSLDKLRAGTGGLVDDVQVGEAPVRRHLAPTGAGIVLGPNRLQKHIEGLDAEHQAKCAVTIVRIEPIGAGTKKKPHSRGHRFVARAGDLK